MNIHSNQPWLSLFLLLRLPLVALGEDVDTGWTDNTDAESGLISKLAAGLVTDNTLQAGAEFNPSIKDENMDKLWQLMILIPWNAVVCVLRRLNFLTELVHNVGDSDRFMFPNTNVCIDTLMFYLVISAWSLSVILRNRTQGAPHMNQPGVKSCK